jgi:SAM-dependent methyltransferase
MSANAEMLALWDGPEGDHWADNAERYEATNAAYERTLLGVLDLGADSTVLDIGCGTGVMSIEAGRIATQGSVLGVDLSSRMLARARSVAAAEGLDHVQFAQADAQVHPFVESAYDVATSSFGGMFFADPVAAFSNIRRGLRPGASLAMLAWRDLSQNAWLVELRSALAAGRDLPTPPPGAQGPFSLADPHVATGRLEAAGFGDVRLSPLDEPMCFGRDVDDAYSFMLTFGITRGLTHDLDEDTRMAALAAMRNLLEQHETSDGVLLDSAAWLIEATNAGAG